MSELKLRPPKHHATNLRLRTLAVRESAAGRNGKSGADTHKRKGPGASSRAFVLLAAIRGFQHSTDD
jgi:hypothetical protein